MLVISQQGMTIVSLQAEDDDMGDLEYLSRIANGELTSGVLKTFTNSSTNTSIIATVPAGKDWYLMGWACSYRNTGVGSAIFLEYPSGTIRDSLTIGGATDNNYIGIVKSFKITASQTVTITKSTNVTNQTNLFILEVDTGVSPKLT